MARRDRILTQGHSFKRANLKFIERNCIDAYGWFAYKVKHKIARSITPYPNIARVLRGLKRDGTDPAFKL